ncbi:trace amine-associated receptor 4-like [Neoarius graeffei]|uniref:trace amine-associated receptor 4-like n=1 Tax=Neoarius graeffei TaxID=443677 RepID=UPI00298C18B2|nr:trace amine-associated receptor 4-like [Neoarius graeffei]
MSPQISLSLHLQSSLTCIVRLANLHQEPIKLQQHPHPESFMDLSQSTTQGKCRRFLLSCSQVFKQLLSTYSTDTDAFEFVWFDTLLMNNTDVEILLLCFPHQPDSCLQTARFFVTRVAMYFVTLTAILMTFLGNLLVIITISHFKHLHSPTHFIILSLAFVDFMMGCLVMPFSTVRWVEGCWFLGDLLCQIHSSLDMTLSIASILHLCLVSVDRFMAITDPLGYKMKVTNGNVAVCIAVSCIFSCMFSFGIVFSKINVVGLDEQMLNPCGGSCVVIFNKEWGIIAPLLNFYIPGAIMTCLYLKIFCVARKQARLISDRTAVLTPGETKKQLSDQRERKAAKTLGIVMGVFLLCWLPFFLTIVIDQFLNYSTPLDVFDALMWFGYLNSMFNPLIYGFFYPRFQKAFKIIIVRYLFHLKSSSNLVLQ